MKTPPFFFLLLPVALLVFQNTALAADKVTIDGKLALIQTEFKVQIHYELEAGMFFPEAWKAPTLSMVTQKIDLNEVDRLIPIIQTFLAKHPLSVVRSELEHIYLLGALSFQGKSYGGTHHNHSMYIVCDGIEQKFSTEFMLRRLHSEFSSILFNYHFFPKNAWAQLNPTGFIYSGNGFEVVDHPSRYDQSERANSEGFLVNYCRSSLENDFNIISAWLFTQKSELDSVSQKHERIRQKQALAEQFYKGISGQYL